MHEAARRLAQSEVDVPSQHILIEGGGAAVRYEWEARTGAVLEVDTGDHPAPPMPTVPTIALPGFSFSQAINSLRSLAGRVFRATIHCGVSASNDTGSKSCTTSYWS